MALDQFDNKKTDPDGDVDVKSDTQGRLVDFDIDGAEVGVDGARLKPNHTAFLKTLIEKMKASPGQKFTIAIGGHTDTLNRSGKFDNAALSKRREAAVARFLKDNTPGSVGLTISFTAFGPSKPLPPNTADSFSRAVDVALLTPGDPPPERPDAPSPEKPRGERPGGPAGPRSVPRAQGRGGFVFGCLREPDIERSQAFKIRITDLQIVSLALGAKTASASLQIVDEGLNLGAEYTFRGVELLFLERPEETFIRKSTGFRAFRTAVATRVTDFQSANLQTGFGTGLKNPLGPLPRPVISLTFKDKDGASQQVQSSIDMDGKEGTLSRFIKGTLSMNSTCRGSRGALELDRTNVFLGR